MFPLTVCLSCLLFTTPTASNVVFATPQIGQNDNRGNRTFTETLVGTVRKTDGRHRRLRVAVPEDAEYEVETEGAFIFLAAARIGLTGDLKSGERIEVIGNRAGQNRFVARTVRVLPAIGARSGDTAFVVEGVVREADTEHARATVADADGRRFTVDYLDAAINRVGDDDGRRGYLERGMRVFVEGTRLPRAVVVADRVRVLSARPQSESAPSVLSVPVQIATPDALMTEAALQKYGLNYGAQRLTGETPVVPAPTTSVLAVVPAPVVVVPVSPNPKQVMESLDKYTGVLIDARHLPGLNRSPAPLVLGPTDDAVYPDRSHVPTPEQVQDASVIRYYRDEAEAQRGVCGETPLILPAQALVGPGHDGFRLSAADMVLLLALDRKLGFSRTWKVGVLVPADH